VPAASPKTRRRSEECTCWLDRYTMNVREPFGKNWWLESPFTSILIDALAEKGLQDGQPEVTLAYIHPQHYIFVENMYLKVLLYLV